MPAMMKKRHFAIAALLCTAGLNPPAVAAPASEIDRAAKGLKAVIEDDMTTKGDEILLGVKTRNCQTTLRAKAQSWVVDWRKLERWALADGFIFLAGPGLQLAIVGDMGEPDQAKKMEALWKAMVKEKARCGGE
jgi:hypothetical protein